MGLFSLAVILFRICLC